MINRHRKRAEKLAGYGWVFFLLGLLLAAITGFIWCLALTGLGFFLFVYAAYVENFRKGRH